MKILNLKINTLPLSVLALGMLTLSACGATGPSEPVANGTTTDQPAATTNGTNGNGNGGNEFIFIQGSNPPSLDPHNNNDSTSVEASSQIFEQLTTFAPDGSVVGLLAHDFYNMDDYTWVFHLEQGVYFHDGAYFNAHAVQKSLYRLILPENASVRAFVLDVIDQVVIIDDYTIHIITESPFGPLPAHLAHAAGKILSPLAIDEENNGGRTVDENPQGTGPFKLLHRDHGNETRFVRNDDYWRTPATIQYLTFRVVPEPATRVMMLEAGEAHAVSLQPQDVEVLEDHPSIHILRTPINRIEYLGFNTQVYPLDNRLVRQALTKAINREDIFYGLAGGMGDIATHVLAPNVLFAPDADSIDGFDFDPEGARELLAQAGYADGFELNLLLSHGNTVRSLTAEYIQHALAQVGVTVNINLLEWGAFLDAIDVGEHDMYLLGWTQGTGDPDLSIWPLYHSSMHGPGGNTVFYTNPRVDQLLEQGRATVDPAVREAVYHELIDIIVYDAAHVFLWHPGSQMGTRTNVSGLFVNAGGTPFFTNVTLD